MGQKMRDDIVAKIEKWQEPPPAKIIKPLPAPDAEQKKRRWEQGRGREGEGGGGRGWR